GALDISPSPITFPSAYVGFTSRQTVTIHNAGTAATTIQQVSLSTTTPFSLDLSGLALPHAIPGGDSSTFDVVYAPTRPGQSASNLTVQSDDPMQPVRVISVTGTAAFAPLLQLSQTRADFGDTAILANATMVITAKNVGGSELRVSSLAI